MFKQQFKVQNPTGLHMRPAGQLAELCKTLPDEIRLVTDKNSVNPKSILNILTAGMKCGTVITVEAEGETEQQSGEKIIDFLSGLTE